MKTLPYTLRSLGLFAILTGLAVSGASAQDVKPGNAEAAKKKIAMCIGCHGIPGYQASFPQVYRVPAISGQGAGYIESALKAYRKGDRKHPTMRAIAAPLTDQDIADIAAYYSASGSNLPKREGNTGTPSKEVQELLSKGNCVACHGEGLNKPIDPSYPKLAGQYADYVFAALKAYQTENNPHIGRTNAIMSAQAKLFKPAELKELADYVGGLPSDLKTVPESHRHEAH